MLFNLDDATHQLVHGQLLPFPRSWQKFWREMEIYPLLAWGNYGLTQALFTLSIPSVLGAKAGVSANSNKLPRELEFYAPHRR